jgi:hypothetical protein
MPAGLEAEAVAFYEGVLGIPHVPKPDHLAARGGCWFEDGDLKVHLGVDATFRPATKTHPAFIVDDVRGMQPNAEHDRARSRPSTGISG